MQQELLQVIEKNLPLEVGEVLRKRLEQADKDAKTAELLLVKNTDLERLLSQSSAMIAKFQNRETAVMESAAINAKTEIDLHKRENDLAKTLADLKATEAEKRADQLKEVLGVVFRSPVYKRNYSEKTDGNSVSSYENGQTVTRPTNFPYSRETKEEITNE